MVRKHVIFVLQTLSEAVHKAIFTSNKDCILFNIPKDSREMEYAMREGGLKNFYGSFYHFFIW